MNPLKSSLSLCIFLVVTFPGSPPRKTFGEKFFDIVPLPRNSNGRSCCFFPAKVDSGLVTIRQRDDAPEVTLLHLEEEGKGFRWKALPIGTLPTSAKGKELHLGRVPFLGETPYFGIVWASSRETPSFFNQAPFLQTPTIEKAPSLGIPLLSTDLDRDGNPELWAMNPDRENEEAAPAILYSAPLAEDPSRGPIPGLEIGGGFKGVLAYDFDQDFLEDLLFFGPGKKVTLALNKGNMSWSLADEEDQPQGKTGGSLQARNLFLSPFFRGKQWLLADAQNEQSFLLERKEGEGFKPLIRDLSALGGKIRDARFLDQDLDGNLELWVLTPKGLFRLLLGSPGLKLIQPISGGSRILIGDLDQDLAPDFCILRKEKSPLLLRNKPSTGGLQRSMVVSLDGIEGFPHAIGAYVELLIGEKVIQRHRWPPQRTDDALALFFSLPDPLNEAASFRVTWPDGNVSESEVKPGTHLLLKH